MTSPLQHIEQLFLGCLLVSDKAYDEHMPKIQPWHFSIAVHERIFRAVSDRYEAGQYVSAALVAPAFDKDSDLSEVGGVRYLYDLAQGVVTATTGQVNSYAEKIYGEHCRRATAQLAAQIQVISEQPEFAVEKDLPAIEAATLDLMAGLSPDEVGEVGAQDLSAAVGKALKDVNAAQSGEFGIRTGLPKLDTHLRGLKAGRLYIAAGRPAMGKTAFGLTLAANAAKSGKKVLFFSIEMGESDLMQRLLARYSGISVDAMNTPGALNPDDHAKLASCGGAVRVLPLKILHRQFLTASTAHGYARRFKRRHGLDLLVIDYLGLMQVEDRRANKVHQIEEITTGLKRLANSLQIPVLLLAQLNRSVEQREDKRPQLSDLRDSGSIEQDADVVMFIFREEYYLQQQSAAVSKGFSPAYQKQKEAARNADMAALKGQAEIIIAKNRQGKTGVITVQFNGERQVFHE